MGATYPRTENDQYNEEYVRQYLDSRVLSEEYIQSLIVSTHGSGEPSVNLARFLLECDGWVGEPTRETDEAGKKYESRQVYDKESKEAKLEPGSVRLRAMEGIPNSRRFHGPRLTFQTAGEQIHEADPKTHKQFPPDTPKVEQRRRSHMHERNQDQAG